MAESKSGGEYKQTVAEIFDGRTGYSHSETHNGLAQRLVQLAAPQPNEQVLDIATGTGFVAVPAAQLVGEKGKVIGVDISTGMLNQAKQAVSAANLKNIELVHADAELFDYASGAFDLIFCCNALPYMSSIPTALQHWCSLLRPGGRLAFNCWAEQSYVTGHLLRAVAARHGIKVALVGQDIGTPERCCAILRDAGFKQPEVVVEPTCAFFSSNQLVDALDSAVKNPLYRITPSDAGRLNDLRAEYIAEAQSSSVKRDIEAEMGAYFVTAHKLSA